MSAKQHDAAPWSFDGRFVGSGHAKANIAECRDHAGCWSDSINAVANARRIAACVNACEGISTEELEKYQVGWLANTPDLLDAALALVSWGASGGYMVSKDSPIGKAKAAISKVIK